MSETTELQTPVEEAALRAREAQPRGRALVAAVATGASTRRPWRN
jgi:hypothetical protein